SAEEQPARNIAGYLSMLPLHYFLDCCSFLVSFIRYDFPFILIRCALCDGIPHLRLGENQRLMGS
ncbi:MAG: hypothetical protein Q8L07_04105, partial [Sediminibacterium sp.]|nr:hypothetical protein [Sediminibacterium sp.]MDP1811763.1 hypothetical protein [Sediminibacterium sp.]MDP3127706.1 hypothetical protein [Sediminibacterium sp.]MDP3665380.1 hypothetical protein [Sediminibacterium sp.]